MDSPGDRDDLLTVAAIGLLAYASADIAHHVLGHGGMCLAAGGHIRSLSSIFVDCTVRGAPIDLAGPFANLLAGALAWAAASGSQRTARLFFALAAGFNLLWFALQLVFSAATRTDDFAWAMVVFHVGEPLRFGLIAIGVGAYMLSMRIVGRTFAPFGPPKRARRIVWTAWLTAGLFACATALFDRHPIPAILHNAAPQSLALSAGLLFIPRYVANIPEEPMIEGQVSWLLCALLVAGASIWLLGPGFAI
jgi:hypothetical protein